MRIFFFLIITCKLDLTFDSLLTFRHFCPPFMPPPRQLLPTHPLKEQQGFAFLPCTDPVPTNYPQSIHQSRENLQICDNEAE